MPPHRPHHGSLSDSDRFSSGDLSGDGPASPGAPAAAPAGGGGRPRRNSGLIELSPGLSREMASHHVRKVSAELPGFTDWRANSPEDDVEEEGASPTSVKEMTSSGGLHRSFNSSTERNIKDIESDVLADLPRAPHHHRSRRGHGGAPSRGPSKKLSRRRGPPRRSKYTTDSVPSAGSSHPGSVPSCGGASLPSIPTVHSGMTRDSLLTEDDPSFVTEGMDEDMSLATGTTERFSNTTRANMKKYKKLYEAMLEEVERENVKEGSRWVGLGTVAEGGTGGGHETSLHSSGDFGFHGSSGRGLDHSGKDHNVSIASKSAFHNSSGSGDGDPLRREEGSKGKNKKGGRHSKHKESKEGDADEDDASSLMKVEAGSGEEEGGKVTLPNTPTTTLLVDEMIDGLQVQEVVLAEAPPPQPVIASHEEEAEATPEEVGPEEVGSAPKDGDEDADEKDAFDLGDVAPRKVGRGPAKIHTPTLDTSERSLRSSFSAFAEGCEPTKKPTAARKDDRPRLDASDKSGRSARPASAKKASLHGHDSSTRSSDRRRKGADKAARKGGRRDRSASRGPSSEASVGSHRSGRSARSHRSHRSSSRGRERSGSRRGRRPSESSEAPRDGIDAAHPDGTSSSEKPTKKGLFRKIKKFAGKVKSTLVAPGVHKYRLGEVARYRVHRPPRGAGELYDPDTGTVEVEIVAVHVDAVLEMPYYTIRLPDDSRKQTNWDNLVPLAEFKRGCVADGGDEANPAERSRPLSRLSFRSLSRGRSASRGRDRSDSVCSGRSSSRRRSSSQGRDEDDRSHASHRSSRSSSSRKSSRSSSSRDKSSRASRPGGSARSGDGGRPRSPSPFSGRDGRSHSSRKRHSSRSKQREDRSSKPHRDDKERRRHHGRSRNEHSSSMKSVSSDFSKGSSVHEGVQPARRSQRKVAAAEDGF